MQGTIVPRVRKNARDAQGKLRATVKVYDVRYNTRDPATGKIVRKMKRGFWRRSDAESFLLDVNKELQDGVFVQPQKILLKDYLREWLETYVKVNVKASTYTQYEKIIAMRLIPWAGGQDIKAITPLKIDKFYAQLLENGRLDGKGGLSAKSVLYIHRVFNEALNHAVRKGILARNPMLSVSNIPRPQKFQASIYSAEELRQLLDAVADNSYWQTAIVLAGICGLRRGECLGLKWSKIDFKHKTISIDEQIVEINNQIAFSTPKSSESTRIINAPPEVFEILAHRKTEIEDHKSWLGTLYDDNDLVVCHNDGRPVRPRNFTHAFCELLERHHMRRIRFHDLRHSCASLMLESGVALKTASEILGHSTITITADLYTHVQQKTKQEAAAKLGSFVFGSTDDSDTCKENITPYITGMCS